MMIDFHTHIYPDKIVKKTMACMTREGALNAYADGSCDGLKASMRLAGITHSVVLPVATRPEQFHSINVFAREITTAEPDKDGLSILSFGGIHPKDPDYKNRLREIKKMGLKGIKLHPCYQDVYINAVECERVIDYASELDLLVTLHCGTDPSCPGQELCTPERIRKMLWDVYQGGAARNLILAHLGGNGMESRSEELLAGGDYYMDLSFCLQNIPVEQLVRIVKKHGTEKILFGTDSPWCSQKEEVEYLKTLPFTQDELELIFYKNGAKLLQII